MQLHFQHNLPTSVKASPNVARVAAMFGLGLDDTRQLTLVPPTTLDLQPNTLVFVTGPSGAGKSTLLRLIREQLNDMPSDIASNATPRLIDFDALAPLPDEPLVDCFAGHALEAVLAALSRAGLNDAFVMLRRPSELSDGQRCRLRLAQCMLMCEREAGADAVTDEREPALTVILADEFCATLDRRTACIVAGNVRRWVGRTPAPVCFIAATTHDDLLDALEPHVLVHKRSIDEIELLCNRG